MNIYQQIKEQYNLKPAEAEKVENTEQNSSRQNLQ
jgi:hypothetical protein